MMEDINPMCSAQKLKSVRVRVYKLLRYYISILTACIVVLRCYPAHTCCTCF